MEECKDFAKLYWVIAEAENAKGQVVIMRVDNTLYYFTNVKDVATNAEVKCDTAQEAELLFQKTGIDEARDFFRKSFVAVRHQAVCNVSRILNDLQSEVN